MEAKEMEPRETAIIKRALQFIKVARGSDYVTFNAMMSGESFLEEVIKPLEQLCVWDKDDEILVAKLTQKFAEETHGHSLQEKSENLKRILAISGGIAVALGLSALVYIKQKKKKNAGK